MNRPKCRQPAPLKLGPQHVEEGQAAIEPNGAEITRMVEAIQESWGVNRETLASILGLGVGKLTDAMEEGEATPTLVKRVIWMAYVATVEPSLLSGPFWFVAWGRGAEALRRVQRPRPPLSAFAPERGWVFIDWRLPDEVIAERLGKSQGVVQNRRVRFKKLLEERPADMVRGWLAAGLDPAEMAQGLTMPTKELNRWRVLNGYRDFDLQRAKYVERDLQRLLSDLTEDGASPLASASEPGRCECASACAGPHPVPCG